MSDLEPYIPTWRRNLMIASLVLLGIFGSIMYVRVFGGPTQSEPTSSQSVHYAEPESACPDYTVEYVISIDEGTECVPLEEHYQREERQLGGVYGPVCGAMPRSFIDAIDPATPTCGHIGLPMTG
jgi:hypothetical protein